MRTPIHIRHTVARLVTASLLTTLALGMVAAPGMAEEVAPATPGPHTIPEDPVLPGEYPHPELGVPSIPDILDRLPDDTTVPEDGSTCEDLAEVLPPWLRPECPGDDDPDDERDEEAPTGPGFPVEEIPLPEDLHEPPFPFDPGEVPFPFDPGSTGDGDEDDEGPEDTGDGSEDTEDSADGTDGTDGSDDTGDGSGDADPEDAEVAGSSTEADEPADGDGDGPEVTTAGGDETPTPTRVDAGAGGSVLTIDRQDAILVLGLVLALGLVATGGVLLTRSTTR